MTKEIYYCITDNLRWNYLFQRKKYVCRQTIPIYERRKKKLVIVTYCDGDLRKVYVYNKIIELPL